MPAHGAHGEIAMPLKDLRIFEGPSKWLNGCCVEFGLQ